MSSGRDLTGTAVVVLAFLAMAGVAWLDLTDGSIGPAFSVGFVLVVVTAPLAVQLRSIVTTGVLPPVLMILTLTGVVLLQPAAVDIDGLDGNAGAAARAIAATLDHGLTLVIGHSLALATIVLRNVWASHARALRLQTS